VNLDKFLTSQRSAGQSLIEYILLFGVISVLAMTVFKSKAFRNYIGPDSNILETVRNDLEYNYTHGAKNPKKSGGFSSNYSGKHDLYYNNQKNETHFFGPIEKYP